MNPVKEMIRRPTTYLLVAALGLAVPAAAQTPLTLTEAIARARTRLVALTVLFMIINTIRIAVYSRANEIEIVFKKFKAKATFNMIVELHQTSPTSQGRVLYDSSDFPTRVEFNCIPQSGKACA